MIRSLWAFHRRPRPSRIRALKVGQVQVVELVINPDWQDEPIIVSVPRFQILLILLKQTLQMLILPILYIKMNVSFLNIAKFKQVRNDLLTTKRLGLAVERANVLNWRRGVRGEPLLSSQSM